MATRKSARKGFTLLELVVVVAIVGILAAIAVPAFRGYINRSRTSEAVTFLGEIKLRQESYRSEFGQYCAVAGSTWGTWNPAVLPTGGTSGTWVSNANWRSLGATPDSQVRFQYATIAGAPGTTPPGGLGYAGNDFWFVSQAIGDLDEDGNLVTFEGYSASNHIWISDNKGWD